MNETIRELKEKGYTVYLLVLAVNKRLSFLGTRLRYEGMKSQYGFGRTVDQKVHDEKYKSVYETLEIVQAANLYDKIILYGRAGRQNTKGKHNGLVVISENAINPATDYFKEREREWSDNDMRYFNDEILYLLRMMIIRKADHGQMQYILDVFDVGHEPGTEEITG
jgi:hypothetical protein